MGEYKCAIMNFTGKKACQCFDRHSMLWEFMFWSAMWIYFISLRFIPPTCLQVLFWNWSGLYNNEMMKWWWKCQSRVSLIPPASSAARNDMSTLFRQLDDVFFFFFFLLVPDLDNLRTLFCTFLFCKQQDGMEQNERILL